MRVPHWFPPKRYNPAHQALMVQQLFPSFTVSGTCGQYVFRGTLQPINQAERYRVSIRYRQGEVPRVFVVDPEIDEDVPHLHQDGSLCLFHPKLFNWHGGRLIARYIVPWTAVWLYFYEKWRELGVWFGPEAPH